MMPLNIKIIPRRRLKACESLFLLLLLLFFCQNNFFLPLSY